MNGPAAENSKRRAWLRAAATAALASGVAACGQEAAPPVPEETPRAWRMATSWAADLPGFAAAASELAGAITRASGGRLTVTAHAAGALVPAFDVFDAVGRGTVEMGHSAAYFWQGRLPAAPYFCAVPFGLGAMEMNAWLHAGGGLALWRELYAPHGLVPFAAGNTGMQMAGWFRREIRSLADLAGLRMRIPGLGGEVMARLGVATVNLPGAELIAALEGGTLDATEWLGPDNDLAFGLPRVAKHCYFPGWQEPAPVLECLVHKPAFDALPADLQAIVSQCCRAANDAVLAGFNLRNAQALAVLRERHGVKFHALPADVLAALRRASVEVLEAAADKDPMTRKVRDAFLAFQAQAAPWSAMAATGSGTRR
jgi:TRAP-type mannitol/chloroaromatic compound transport system substrate-binding protein